MKYSASLGRQDIADFVPNGASFSASNLATDTDHEAGDGKLDDAAKSATELPSNLLMPTEGSLKKGKLRSPDIRLEVPVAQRPDQIPSVGAIAPGLMHKFNSIAVKENSAYVQGMKTQPTFGNKRLTFPKSQHSRKLSPRAEPYKTLQPKQEPKARKER